MAAKDILRGEMIGLQVEVTGAANPALKGIKGIIIDETKNTLRIERGNKTKTILKEQVTLKITKGQRTVRVDGSMLLGRPEDRVRK